MEKIIALMWALLFAAWLTWFIAESGFDRTLETRVPKAPTYGHTVE